MGLEEFKRTSAPDPELSVEDVREEYENGPPEDMSTREWIEDLSARSGMSVEELLIGGQDDPMWAGTETDHKKATWFRELWEESVAEREEDRVHVRGVHYYVVMRDEPVEPPTPYVEWEVYENSDRCYQYLGDAAVLARILDYVPFDGIEDRKNETRQLIKYGDHSTGFYIGRPSIRGVSIPDFSTTTDRAEMAFDDVESFTEYAIRQFSRNLKKGTSYDLARQQPYHIELWSEKALPDEITETARDAGVNVVVTGQGQLSAQVARNFVRRVNRAGKPAVILYLCDYDAAGDWMPPAMARKIEWHRKKGQLDQEVSMDVLAITEDQIETYGLPPKPAGESDLAKSREERLDQDGIVELNALEGRMQIYKKIVREKVAELTDDNLEDKNEEAIEKRIEQVEAEVKAAVDEAEGVAEAIDMLAEWVEEHNELIEEASEVIQRIREHEDDERYTNWKSRQRGIAKSVTVPEAEIPDGDAELPVNPVYDTRRTFDENVERIRKFRRDENE